MRWNITLEDVLISTSKFVLGMGSALLLISGQLILSIILYIIFVAFDMFVSEKI